MILHPGWRNGGRRCVESDDTGRGFGIRDGMSDAGTAREVPSSKMMRYWGDVVESNGISMTVPARVGPVGDLVSRTLVPGG